VSSFETLHGGKNGLVYKVTVEAEDPTQLTTQSTRPGTSPLPSGAVDLVMRIANPDAILNETIRVQNEAAAMTLMRQALADIKPSLVPDVYGWSPASEGRGWLLMQSMPGVPLVDKFSDLDAEKQRDLVSQIARVFKLKQTYQLPPSVKGYGGLNFDSEGNIVVGPTPIAGGGPSDSFAELYAEYFQTQRALADTCDVVQGWSGTEVQGRLDKFAAEGLKPLLDDLQAKLAPRPTLVHGDFGKN